MDSNVAKRNNITLFHLRANLTKILREAGHCFTNHGELLKRRRLMEFACQECRDLHPLQKGLNHITGLNNVLQVEVFTPHMTLVR